MGIVHHANYLLYVEEARVEYLRRRGIRYEDWVARDLHFAVVDARLRYRTASQFGDDLEIETWVGSASRVSVRFDYRIRRLAPKRAQPAQEERVVIADAYTTLACVDSSRTPRRIPAEILELITRAEDSVSA